jgi:hypothetical protein
VSDPHVGKFPTLIRVFPIDPTGFPL